MDQLLRDAESVYNKQAPSNSMKQRAQARIAKMNGKCFKESTSPTIWRVRTDTAENSYHHWDAELNDYLVVYYDSDRHGHTDPGDGTEIHSSGYFSFLEEHITWVEGEVTREGNPAGRANRE